MVISITLIPYFLYFEAARKMSYYHKFTIVSQTSPPAFDVNFVSINFSQEHKELHALLGMEIVLSHTLRMSDEQCCRKLDEFLSRSHYNKYANTSISDTL